MSFAGRALAAVLASAALVPAPPVHPRDPSTIVEAARTVLVRGVVLDYARRPAAGARVSGAGGSGWVSAVTDGRGQFVLRVSAGSYLSASKSDMMGSIVVGDAAEQDVVVVMRQMPI
jgi:hypothetical protein